MLPSAELRELSKRVDINLSGKISPKGCDIRFRQFYWMMIFNPEGELMYACNLSDELTKRMKIGLFLPQAFVSSVESGLRAEHSLEDLEQRYIAEHGTEAAYLALRDKVEAMAGVGQMRVAAFLSKATETADPGLSRARGILVATDACNRQVINHAAYAALRKSIESFVREFPTHPSAPSLIEPLGNVALKYTFDLSSKCEAYAREWMSVESGSKEVKASLAELARQLLEYRDTEIARAEKRLREFPEAYGALTLRARLGQAQETLTGLDNGQTFGVFKPIHAEWRTEATTKMMDR